MLRCINYNLVIDLRHAIFWLFRLQEDTFTFEEIDQKVRKKELKDLLTVDQLSQARADGQAFSELDETIPDFPPTFKYKVSY